MIDKEKEIFNSLSGVLHGKYDIYLIGAELSEAPPKFPAVSFLQTNNITRTEYSTFVSLENVAQEEYKAEVFSNLETGKEAQTKDIIKTISDCLASLGYERTFCELVPNADPSICRRMARFRKNYVI